MMIYIMNLLINNNCIITITITFKITITQLLQLQQQNIVVKIKGESVKDEVQIKEYGEGFVSREKIARTPPDEKE